MTVWDSYPTTYRSSEIAHLLEAVRAGECCWVVGLSGSGKSNLAGFFVDRAASPLQKILVDCNRLTDASVAGLFRLMRRMLGDTAAAADEYAALEAEVEKKLKATPAGLCLVIDRFETLPADQANLVGANLRALRDSNKYLLTYVITSRQQPDPHSELAELFLGHLLWLGPLSEADSLWSARQYAARANLDWTDAQLHLLIAASGGYASLLRAVCEAAARGCPFEVHALQADAAVRRRVTEFWDSKPGEEDRLYSGLSAHPLLNLEAEDETSSQELTANEARLLAYLQTHAHQVCEKDELVKAVWPEDRVYVIGIRDDSLAQLVRRLRIKVEEDPAKPKHIQTVPGRGYRYKA